MTGWQIAILVCVFVVVDLVVVGSVLQLAGSSLRELAAKYPAVPPMPGAVRKEFQSFRFDMVKLGGCVHVTVDEKHLHMDPAWLARVSMRMKGMSVPWEAIRLKEASPRRIRGQRSASFTIGSVDVVGPAWAVEIARAGSNEGGL